MLLSSGSICSRPSSDFIFQIPSCPSALGLLGQNTRQDYGLQQQKPISPSSGCWNIQGAANFMSSEVFLASQTAITLLYHHIGIRLPHEFCGEIQSPSHFPTHNQLFGTSSTQGTKHTGFLVQARYLDNVSQIWGWQSGWVCPSEKLIYWELRIKFLGVLVKRTFPGFGLQMKKANFIKCVRCFILYWNRKYLLFSVRVRKHGIHSK